MALFILSYSKSGRLASITRHPMPDVRQEHVEVEEDEDGIFVSVQTIGKGRFSLERAVELAEEAIGLDPLTRCVQSDNGRLSA